ncbi:MAG: DUF2892 domain-containing protein [Deltaproteobacteria bacterium]|nr:DUF2892 domain-containing protein [Deltaproteobacteria bacterium]
MAERIQRLMMAGMISLGLILYQTGFKWGLYVDWFVVFMVIVWAVTGFCPSLYVLKKSGMPSETE